MNDEGVLITLGKILFYYTKYTLDNRKNISVIGLYVNLGGGAGCWMLDAGCWMLDAGYCLLPIAYCLLPTAYCLLPNSNQRIRHGNTCVLCQPGFAGGGGKIVFTVIAE